MRISLVDHSVKSSGNATTTMNKDNNSSKSAVLMFPSFLVTVLLCLLVIRSTAVPAQIVSPDETVSEPFFHVLDKGVDISSENGRINWKAMCSCGNLKFAFIRATEGSNWSDPYFERNFNESVAHNLKTGIWHQFRTSEHGISVTPEQQVSNILSALQRVSFDAKRQKIAVATKNRPQDMEEEDEKDPALRRGKTGSKLSNIQMSNRLYRLMRLIKKRTGVNPILLTNGDIWNEYFHTEERSFIEFDLWVSQHIITYNISEVTLRNMSPRLPSGFATYNLWQYTNQGFLPGVRPGSDVPVSIAAADFS